jgi:hypothetical protein
MAQRRVAAAAHLARELRVWGPLRAGELRRRLRLPPATFTRTVAAMRGELLAVGATTSLTYALRRVIPGLPPRIPVYELGPDAVGHFATLVPVEPGGFYVESDFAVRGFYPDLPWFLHDLRPAGFLGRLVPRRHPDLGLPADIQTWTADHVLRWLHEWGCDTVGSFVVGDPAFQRRLQVCPERVGADRRAARYPELADEVLALGVPGSSAAGEQPKFLTERASVGGDVPVLVKFSPPGGEPAARRTADLLRCEHHALRTLRAANVPAAASALVEGGGRVFLEVERFDRRGEGRLGLVSLFAVAANAGADLHAWAVAGDQLAASGVIGAEAQRRIHFLDRFGVLIGNTDRHAGNLSFFFAEGRVGDLAPVYDMLPMAYAVRAGEFATPHLDPPSPTPNQAWAWRAAWGCALLFWGAVAGDPSIAAPLRAAAEANAARLREGRRLLDRLPADPPDAPVAGR